MRHSTQAAILCGGRGERLKPLTDYFQKVMIPIGPKKLPLLAYIIALVKHHGITDIVLLTGYRSQDISHYFGDGSSHNVSITYSEDEKGVKGSLNAVANAIRSGAISNCDELLIYYGDVLTELDIGEMLARHRKSRNDVTLALDNGYTLPVGVAEVRGGMVKAFREKPKMDISVTTGIMVAGKKGMDLMKNFASKTNTDLMTDFVPELIRTKGKVGAFYNKKEWFDVGTVSSFQKLNEELGKHPLSFLV